MRKSISRFHSRWPRISSMTGMNQVTWSTSATSRLNNCTIAWLHSSRARRPTTNKPLGVHVNRLAFALLLLAQVAASAQSFSVTFPKDVNAQPLDGRLLLVLSTDPSDEPRNQIDDSPRTQMVFGLTVDGWRPGESAIVDSSAWG